MSARESFEKWILQDYVEDYIRKEPLHGCYAHTLIEDYWNAWEPSWKASRAQAIDEFKPVLEDKAHLDKCYLEKCHYVNELQEQRYDCLDALRQCKSILTEMNLEHTNTFISVIKALKEQP